MMKKKLATIMTGTMILSPLAFTLPNDINPISENNNVAHAEGKVIATQTLSKGEVKSMASTMSKRYKNINDWADKVSALFGKYKTPVEASILASNHAQKKTVDTFKSASKQGKKVKVIIKSGPTPNLNTVDYEIVN